MERVKAEKRAGAGRAWTDEEYSRLTGVLVSQKRLGNYPITATRLLELANMPWPGEKAFRDAGVANRFVTTAGSRAKKDAVLSALVFLHEDWSHLAGYERTLRYFIEKRLAGVRSQACTVAQMLAECSSSQVREVLKRQITERIKARQLPTGIGALKMGASDLLFLFDQIIGRPTDSTANLASRQPAKEAGRAVPSREVASELENAEPRAATVRAEAETGPSSAPLESRRSGGNVPTDGPFDACGLASRMEETFDRLDRQSGGHNQVLLLDLRRELGVSREDFDACMDRLRRGGVFTLSPVEGRFGGLPMEQVEAGIEGPSGRLVYAARR